MKRLYSSLDSLLVGYLKGLLEDQGIPCLVKNGFLGGAAGEIPLTECWPELWVAKDSDLARARLLLDQTLAADPRPASPWRCPHCGETLEGQFTSCWNCGTARPADNPS